MDCKLIQIIEEKNFELLIPAETKFGREFVLKKMKEVLVFGIFDNSRKT